LILYPFGFGMGIIEESTTVKNVNPDGQGNVFAREAGLSIIYIIKN
jgi:hypothetical protein